MVATCHQGRQACAPLRPHHHGARSALCSSRTNSDKVRSHVCALPSSRRNFGMQVVGDKAVIFGGCGVTKSNEPCVSNQTYYLHMGSDPMKWEEADLMGDVPPPRWRHTATLLPDGVRSAPPSPRCPCRPDATRPLLTLCLPAAAAHVTGQHHDVRRALQGQACRRPHSSHSRLLPVLTALSAPATTPAPASPDARAHLARSLSARRAGATTTCTCSPSRRTSGRSRSARARCRSRARTPASPDAGQPPRAREQPGCRVATASLPPHCPCPPSWVPPGRGLRPRRASTWSRGGRGASPCAAHAPSMPPSMPPSAATRPLASAQPPHCLDHRGGGGGRAVAAHAQGVHPGRLRRAGHLARLLHGRALPCPRHLDLGEGACQHRVCPACTPATQPALAPQPP